MRFTERLGKAASYVVPAILIAAAWQIIPSIVPFGKFRFGTTTLILEAALREAQSLSFYQDVCITISETVLGLLLGTLFGTMVGMLFWLRAEVGRVMRPYVIFGGSIPMVAVAPLMIEVFGIGFVPKVLFVSLSTFFVAVVQAFEGAQYASGERLDVMAALGANKMSIMKQLIFPSSFTYIIAGLRLNVGFALIGAFVAEFVNSERGLGHFIMQHSGLYDTPSVMLGVVVLGFIGIGINLVITWIMNRIAPSLVKASTVALGG